MPEILIFLLGDSRLGDTIIRMPQHRIDQMSNISKNLTTRTMDHVFAALLIVFMINGCNAIAQSPAKSPKAILIIVDGVPADVLERSDTPNMDEIAGAQLPQVFEEALFLASRLSFAATLPHARPEDFLFGHVCDAFTPQHEAVPQPTQACVVQDGRRDSVAAE